MTFRARSARGSAGASGALDPGAAYSAWEPGQIARWWDRRERRERQVVIQDVREHRTPQGELVKIVEITIERDRPNRFVFSHELT